MSYLEYNLGTIKISEEKPAQVFNRDLDFWKQDCVRFEDGSSGYSGGYSWMVEGESNTIYYFYYSSGKRLRVDEFQEQMTDAKASLKLLRSGSVTGNYSPLCKIPGTENFLCVITENAQALHLCKLVEKTK